ncbi:hypothetical protein AVEN_146426-1 [Araneus ventricosus]|uniref:Uncharacterized protein n=1 Tax=Araneus ventricosus TaxID=182803 RepID=A0A4Y2NGE4_ARAVE|nr:hypothetical protein AVEN_146426-1 [Araneus ventricosus]
MQNDTWSLYNGFGSKFVIDLKGYNKFDLTVRYRFQSRRVPRSRHASSKNRLESVSGARQIRRDQISSCWLGTESWRDGCRLRCRPRHLTAVQNDEVRPKIALVFL